ncbi:hypothetical protein C0995_014617 [Termitomyces sp. Mi166|nr:hypothetical protein C0995_014617 [Termitomyces sp. Mi166\
MVEVKKDDILVLPPGRRFLLIDTPGFDNVLVEDWQIVVKISEFIKSLQLQGKPRRQLVVLYVINIDHPQRQIEALERLCIPGILEYLVILTSKWSNHQQELGQEWERSLSADGRIVRSFHNVPYAGWAIIEGIPQHSVNISDFRHGLASAIPAPQPSSRRRSAQLFAKLFSSIPTITDKSLESDSKPRNRLVLRRSARPSTPDEEITAGTSSEAPINADVATALDAIGERLATTFQIKREYRKLLSCRGSDAQALLDTFQLILSVGQPEERLRRDLIVATRRLSAKTDLYPQKYILEGVEKLDRDPIINSGDTDIYRGRYQGKVVCLKIFKIYRDSIYENIVKAIAREAILWGQLSHPNLLPFYGIYRFGHHISLICPWAENGTIDEFLKENPGANRVLLCLDVGRGVDYLHLSDIVHGDLKGANILVDRSGQAYLADFGLAGINDPNILHWASQSRADSKGGTTRWQAPELFTSESDDNVEDHVLPNTKPSDVYAWACVCYQIFTGLLPFHQYHGSLVLPKLKDVRPMRPTEFRNGLTETIWDLMNSCWSFNPAQRPSIHHAVSVLQRFQPMDRRPSREWKPSTSKGPYKMIHADIPLTLKRLECLLIDDRAAQLDELSARLKLVLKDVQEYSQLLASRGSEAKAILEMIQLVLRSKFPDGEFWCDLVVAAQRLASLRDLYPAEFLLTDVDQVEMIPVTSGAHAKIYKGNQRGQAVCLKVAYMVQSSRREKIIECWDIAQGVAYLHQHSIVHGDLKGLNILVDNCGRARIGGFGSSSIDCPSIPAWGSFPRVASRGGSIRWQAPELFTADLDEDFPINTKATDVYAWGCVCYEIFTGKCPFHEIATDEAVAVKVALGAKPAQVRAWGLLHDIRQLMERCWERDPINRPTIEQVVERMNATRPEDNRNRPVGNWSSLPSAQRLVLGNSDVPLTLSTLSAIISRRV